MQEQGQNPVIDSLRTFFEPGAVFEIRVLDAVSPGSSWPHTESGYFEYDQIDLVPNCLANFASYGGVYITMNPVNPDLLARASNRLKPAKNGEGTSDSDVLYRCWMLIDIDPVRPAGISANETEKAIAFDKAIEIQEGLASMGFPAPIVVDSGNGMQLLYRVDLPADDGGLVQRCLKALEPCSNEKVHVDLSVHNAARICRLPGTWNRKGDEVSDRVHRVAEVLETPENIEMVSETLLQKLAGPVASSPEPNTPPFDSSNPIADDFNARGDIAPTLTQHGWTLKSEGDQQEWWRPGRTSAQKSATYNGTTFYVFSDNATPFEANKGYSRFSVYAKLEHGDDFASATKALKTQGYGPKDDDVDISGLLAKFNIPMADRVDVASSTVPFGIGEFQIKSLGQLIQEFDGLNPPVIHGMLREGETMNIIASPKVGKSWFAMRMAISIATGIDWFDFGVEQGKVLHIDNELFENTLCYRYQKVSEALGFDPQLFQENVDTISLRGKLSDLGQIGQKLKAIPQGKYKLVIVDAFYRTLPDGTDENDNGAIARLYNQIDLYAARLGCGFVLIHHSSKGNQAGKSVTDVGAGAGSQSRAVDTHMIIRPHEVDDVFVMDTAIRSWAPVAPMAIAWNWPLFTPTAEVDTSALMGKIKPKEKTKEIVLDEFVERCIAQYDPCSKQSVRYEAARTFEMSERKADETLNLAMERGCVSRIRIGSQMRYVKNRPGICGDKALWIAAILDREPGKDAKEVAEIVGATRQRVSQVKQELALGILESNARLPL